MSMTGSGAGSDLPLLELPPALVLPDGGLDGAFTGFMDDSIADLRSSLSNLISQSTFNASTLHMQATMYQLPRG